MKIGAAAKNFSISLRGINRSPKGGQQPANANPTLVIAVRE
jgi:hypothetical protein